MNQLGSLVLINFRYLRSTIGACKPRQGRVRYSRKLRRPRRILGPERSPGVWGPGETRTVSGRGGSLSTDDTQQSTKSHNNRTAPQWRTTDNSVLVIYTGLAERKLMVIELVYMYHDISAVWKLLVIMWWFKFCSIASFAHLYIYHKWTLVYQYYVQKYIYHTWRFVFGKYFRHSVALVYKFCL